MQGVTGLGFRFCVKGFGVVCRRFEILGAGLWGLGCRDRVQGLGCCVSGQRFRTQADSLTYRYSSYYLLR